MPANKAKKMGSQKDIASDDGDQSKVTGRDESRNCLECTTFEVREVRVPHRCDHGSYWSQQLSSARGSRASIVLHVLVGMAVIW